MNIRKITSFTAILAFIVLAWTSLVLYIEPHGRVAYWVDWRFWGLSKSQWDGIHINVGILFLLAISLHIYYNWKVIISYLKHRANKLRVFNAHFAIALFITFIFVTGTHIGIPPFRWVLELNESIKESAGKKYGKPPYGHAELSSLETLVFRMGLDLSKTLRGLKDAGIRVQNEKEIVQEIARKNNTTPRQIYEAIKRAQGMAGLQKGGAPWRPISG